VNSSPQITPIFTFWVFIHISGMGETRFFKFSTHAGHVKYVCYSLGMTGEEREPIGDLGHVPPAVFRGRAMIRRSGGGEAPLKLLRTF